VLSLSILNFNDSPLGSFYAKMRVKKKRRKKFVTFLKRGKQRTKGFLMFAVFDVWRSERLTTLKRMVSYFHIFFL
jgi:hypothetical protein